MTKFNKDNNPDYAAISKLLVPIEEERRTPFWKSFWAWYLTIAAMIGTMVLIAIATKLWDTIVGPLF